MNLNRVFDCTVGSCVGGIFLWLGDHWMAMLGVALLLWRCIQAFILEPLGIFWPRPRDRSQDGTHY